MNVRTYVVKHYENVKTRLRHILCVNKENLSRQNNRDNKIINSHESILVYFKKMCMLVCACVYVYMHKKF